LGQRHINLIFREEEGLINRNFIIVLEDENHPFVGSESAVIFFSMCFPVEFLGRCILLHPDVRCSYCTVLVCIRDAAVVISQQSTNTLSCMDYEYGAFPSSMLSSWVGGATVCADELPPLTPHLAQRYETETEATVVLHSGGWDR
jgi:hypothetical protein